ncbi:MAG TPA: carbon storage regulator CsrA [Longimicrobiales bacterium]|nr:carbon storage regulator CsrA [Longimicrobiales bacterium]
MLILSRKPGDAILIDGDIRIVVLAVESGGVRLGIDAPASIGIVREEVLLRIAEENRRAAAGPNDGGFADPVGLDKDTRREASDGADS